ncbi:TetR family transcriptional regulator [Streptomyces sp. NPDC002088]|uniref:TetR family transcriptional regulator n=1 Tax=Streptomyces sp. NPDC002088 TaxID=3154665 RepID=UPI003331C170
MRLFAEQGYRSATMTDIGAAVGIREPSVSRTLCVPGVSGLFGRGVAVCGCRPVVRSSG